MPGGHDTGCAAGVGSQEAEVTFPLRIDTSVTDRRVFLAAPDDESFHLASLGFQRIPLLSASASKKPACLISTVEVS